MSDRDKLLPVFLRHLRETKRKTIEEVAQYLEITPDDVKQYENGEKKLRPALFIGLASLFKIPINVFELKEPDGKSMFQYRRTFGDKKLEEYTYTLYGYMNNIVRIYKNNKINIFSIPTVDNLEVFDKTKIIEYTKILRDALGLSEIEPIQNLPKKLDDLGIEVIYTELPNGMNGVSYTVNKQDTEMYPIIFFISNDDNLYKQSFSIAHEFGHIMMHSGIDDTGTQLEEMANYFANVFLLPPNDVVNKICNILNNDFYKENMQQQMYQDSKLYKLCNQYSVSFKTILWSLYHAEKINSDLLKELCEFYDNQPQENQLPIYQGRKDCKSYNDKMSEAMEKNIITRYEYDYFTGFSS